jgi:hypothetical protein
VECGGALNFSFSPNARAKSIAARANASQAVWPMPRFAKLERRATAEGARSDEQPQRVAFRRNELVHEALLGGSPLPMSFGMSFR